MMEPEYLDYNATTPLDPRVFEVMKEWYLGPPANAGSRTHVYGQRAKEAVEVARKQVADVIDAQPEEIYFTSGATESNNIAILGLTAFGERTGRKHIISTAIEHKAVLEPLEEMRRRGFEVDLAPVTSGGFVEVETIEKLLRPDTLLVSVMHANNETGVLQPIVEISELVSETDAFFHTDAAQTFAKEIEELRQAKCDFISISGHKIFGPQGVGALYVRRVSGKKRPLEPIVFGGGQERGLRAGTIPVPLSVGLGKASQLAMAENESREEKAEENRRRILEALAFVEHELNGDQRRCQPHVINIRFPGVDSEALMMALKEKFAISNGSACTASSYAPSHVLLAMGLVEDEATESIRISSSSRFVNIEELCSTSKRIQKNSIAF
jgi:cysteine desulfurase